MVSIFLCTPPILTLRVMVLRGGAFEGHEDGTLMNVISVLRKEALDSILTLYHMST